MCIKYILLVLMLVSGLSVFAQSVDSAKIKLVELDSITITGDSYKKASNRNSALSIEVIDKDFLRQHFTGNLVQSLEHISGVRSMDIGSGFSKPMIRGMAFNRISVIENGIKQEGQQWGSDHGLEIDAFNVERVTVRKGPVSLLYGSDAMGGAIEISRSPAPTENQLFGEAVLLTKTVNGTLGGSVMLGIKKDTWHTKLRYTEQHYGDYHVPTDSIVYLTMRIPLYGRKLKNTAGYERDISLFSEFREKRYSMNYAISNTYQKTGFFPGAHGIPDISRVQDDGNSRNIELPYSMVNHFKVTTHQQYIWNKLIGSWDIGYQNNHREEWSLFHTHYGNQPLPENNPDKELEFRLNTYNSLIKIKTINSATWEHTVGWDIQYQQNRIDGYSFLLPEYNRFTTGVFAISNWRASKEFSVSGGVRYDYGKVNISSYTDPYLETYLHKMNYSDELIKKYKWRSYPVKRNFSNISGSLGAVWNPKDIHWVKANIGRSFRLPGANELASNGVHHGTFRHEQGDPALSSEQGWQLDISYAYESNGISFSVSPFTSWFSNYIYLKPTGEWSILPHAGQIYRYTGVKAFFAGAEISFSIDFLRNFKYQFSGEYIRTRNIDERTPLSFSPPASMRNTLMWQSKHLSLYSELESIAPQKNVAKNELVTSGTNLIHLGGAANLYICGTLVELNLSLQNLFNTKYFNHLSFYRKVEIPEPGRNFQLSIKVPFKQKLR